MSIMNLEKYSKVNILMWVVYPILFVVFMLIMFFTYIQKGDNEQIVENKSDSIIKREFVMVSIPQDITAPKERANYLVIHYWDNFNFSDTVYIHQPEITEQAFANYINILLHSSEASSYLSIKSVLTKSKDSSLQMYGYFLEMYKKYLYDANSPMRDDEYYIFVVDYILKDTVSDMVTKERAKFALSMIQKNRKGKIATNFNYTLQSGKRGTLYQIKSEYLLLLFYNPDCHACSETITYIKESKLINTLLKNNQLNILAFYPDEDLHIWKRYLTYIPDTWINSYDQGQIVKNKLLYDLKAIPSLYLLDKDKRVLLKDTNMPDIEFFLKTKTSSSMLYDNESSLF